MQTVRKGKDAKIQCKAIGDKPITITWLKDKITFKPENDQRYHLKEELTSEGNKTNQLQLV